MIYDIKYFLDWGKGILINGGTPGNVDVGLGVELIIRNSAAMSKGTATAWTRYTIKPTLIQAESP